MGEASPPPPPKGRKRPKSAWELSWDIKVERPRGGSLFGGVEWDPETRTAWHGRKRTPETGIGLLERSKVPSSVPEKAKLSIVGCAGNGKENKVPYDENTSLNPLLNCSLNARAQSNDGIDVEKAVDVSRSENTEVTSTPSENRYLPPDPDVRPFEPVDQCSQCEVSESAFDQDNYDNDDEVGVFTQGSIAAESEHFSKDRNDIDIDDDRSHIESPSSSSTKRETDTPGGFDFSLAPKQVANPDVVPEIFAGFTTGRGKKIHVSHADALRGAKLLSDMATPDMSKEISHTGKGRMVGFTTGKGKTVDITPKQMSFANNRLFGMTTPNNTKNKSLISPVTTGKAPSNGFSRGIDGKDGGLSTPYASGSFTTGKGGTVQVPDTSVPVSGFSFPDVSPVTAERNFNSATKPFTSPLRRMHALSRNKNATPVKRRLIREFGNKNPSKAPRRTPVGQAGRRLNIGKKDLVPKPKLSKRIEIPLVPFLSRDGSLYHPPLNGFLQPKVLSYPNMTNFPCSESDIVTGSDPFAECWRLARSGPNACVDYSFHHKKAGDRKLVSYILGTAGLNHSSPLDLSLLLQWVRSLFPGVANRPATCIGSDAWTRLAYGLAVWKHARLEAHFIEGKTLSHFLTFANIGREVLRRIQIEWNNVKTPTLLQILRRDASPSSHIRLLVADRQFTTTLSYITVTDGWYLAGVKVPRFLQSKIHIGEFVHIEGARLINAPSESVIGSWIEDVDEMGSNCLDVGPYNIRKAKKTDKFARLGLQKGPMVIKRLAGIKWGNKSRCIIPCVDVIVQRVYPVRYVETKMHEGESKTISRREDAEAKAREEYHYEMQENRRTMAENGTFDGDEDNLIDGSERRVSQKIEFLVTGIDDDVGNDDSWGLVAMWKPVADLLAFLREGRWLRLRQISVQSRQTTIQTYNVVGRIEPLRQGPQSNERAGHFLPRKAVSLAFLLKEKLNCSQGFDGAFTVIHIGDVTVHGSSAHRKVYMADDPGDLKILAVELSGDDAENLAKVFLQCVQKKESSIICCARDITFEGYNKSVGILQGVASTKADFVSLNAARVRGRKSEDWRKLAEVGSQVEKAWNGKRASVELYRDTVLALIEGNSKSIGAFVFGSQVSQPG